VLNLKEKTTTAQHWFSYFQIAHKHLKIEIFYD